MRLLLVEDNYLYGDSINRFLDMKGYDVVWAMTYGQARNALANDGPFDAVVLDYELDYPHTAHDVLSLMASSGVETPIILNSGLDRPDVDLPNANKGADALISWLETVEAASE